MSKIICDVCGTSYPETATQCPICGCVRPADARTVAGDTYEQETAPVSTYTYVKGGRFSKANVKKRNSGKQVIASEPVYQPEEKEPEKKKSEVGLIITVCALLLAVIAVVVYIAVHFFAPGNQNKDPNSGTAPDAAATAESTQQTTQPTVIEIPCEDIVISKTIIELDKVGAGYLLNVTQNPKDTTEVVQFYSSDEAVAIVSDDGKITAVGPGEAMITITCGEATAECQVICNIETEPTETTEPTVDPSFSVDDFKLNRKDFTLTQKGATWKLYDGDIPVKQITWTSDDEKVVTIKDGVVTAVGSGMTQVHGEYDGTKLSCTVRCSAAVGKPSENTTNSTTDAADPSAYSISTKDVTIAVGEVFTLTLLDSNDDPVTVIWTAANDSICAVSGNDIKGLATGTTEVFVVYDGQTYKCIVRVK